LRFFSGIVDIFSLQGMSTKLGQAHTCPRTPEMSWLETVRRQIACQRCSRTFNRA